MEKRLARACASFMCDPARLQERVLVRRVSLYERPSRQQGKKLTTIGGADAKERDEVSNWQEGHAWFEDGIASLPWQNVSMLDDYNNHGTKDEGHAITCWEASSSQVEHGIAAFWRKKCEWSNTNRTTRQKRRIAACWHAGSHSVGDNNDYRCIIRPWWRTMVTKHRRRSILLHADKQPALVS